MSFHNEYCFQIEFFDLKRLISMVESLERRDCD